MRETLIKREFTLNGFVAACSVVFIKAITVTTEYRGEIKDGGVVESLLNA